MFQWHLSKIPTAPFCPSEVQGIFTVPCHASSWRKFLAFMGPGLPISVGYMDPGNWATDIDLGRTGRREIISTEPSRSQSAIALCDRSADYVYR